MQLQKLEDFERHYRETFGDNDLNLGLDVYAEGTNEKIGTIGDVLVDEEVTSDILSLTWAFGCLTRES